MSISASVILTFATILLALVSSEAKAEAESYSVVTARGTKLELLVERAQNASQNAAEPTPVLILAPGQACQSSTEILDQVSAEARQSGYATLRFQWSYCETAGSALPSPFLIDEIDDLESALSFAKTHPAFDRDQIVLAGKTQGSFVAYRAFIRQPSVRALALLTPVCTYTVDGDNQPLPAPIMVGYENYPYLAIQRRPILFLAGANDKSCLVSALSDLLRETSANVEKSVVSGDHAFRIYEEDGTLNASETSRNIQAAAQAFTAWLTRLSKVGT